MPTVELNLLKWKDDICKVRCQTSRIVLRNIELNYHIASEDIHFQIYVEFLNTLFLVNNMESDGVIVIFVLVMVIISLFHQLCLMKHVSSSCGSACWTFWMWHTHSQELHKQKSPLHALPPRVPSTFLWLKTFGHTLDMWKPHQDVSSAHVSSDPRQIWESDCIWDRDMKYPHVLISCVLSRNWFGRS